MMPATTPLEGVRAKVFRDRYALKDAEGYPLETTPEELWRRVAHGVAAAERSARARQLWEQQFYALLQDFKFVPAGRILSGAGTNHDVTYYNCYVVGIGEEPLNPDAPRRPQLDPVPARQAFFTALAEMTDIMARSGGVGMNLSSLPPRGTDQGVPPPARHLLLLSVHHPDILEFVAQSASPDLAHVDLGVISDGDFEDAVMKGEHWAPSWEGQHGAAIAAAEVRERILASPRPLRIVYGAGGDGITLADSRESIVAGAATLAAAQYQGEARCVDFSRLRPRGAYIKTVNGTSSGPVSWMYLFDAVARLAGATEPAVIHYAEIASTITGKTIQQGGSRRGALMLMLDDDHPDVEAFIAAKRIGPDGRPVLIEHANMSVCISDAFMAAVKDDLPWDLTWQGRTVRTVRARDLWQQICAAAHATAEPGVVFMQRAREQSPMWYRENIRCTNPCGEQAIPAGAVCNLGAMNLAQYVDAHGECDVARLRRDVATAVRFMDNVIDVTPYFSDLHVKMQQEGTRRIGLGTMGLADALIKMGIRYGSDESLVAIARIYGAIRDAAYEQSVHLAMERGPFGFFDSSRYLEGPFIQTLNEHIRAGIAAYGIRNGVLLTQAPTGTTSLLAGVSSGIEPVFDFAIERTDRMGTHLIYHPLYEAWRRDHPGEAPPDYFVTTRQLTPEDHVRVQAAIQRATDSSISKTTNSPQQHTVAEVERLYMLAYDLGCKGVTYYREGSRDAVLVAHTPAPAPEEAPRGASPLTPLMDEMLRRAKTAGCYSQPMEDYLVAHRTLVGFNEAVEASEDAVPVAPSWLVDRSIKARMAEIDAQQAILNDALTQVRTRARHHKADDAQATGYRLQGKATDEAYDQITQGTEACDRALRRLPSIVGEGSAPAPGLADEDGDEDVQDAPVYTQHTRERADVMFGYTRKIVAPEGTANITINSDQDGPFEVFINIGRAGSDVMALAEALGRLISLTLRIPSPLSPADRLAAMAGQLRDIGGSRAIGFGPYRVTSLPDAVAKTLARHIEEGLSDVVAVSGEIPTVPEAAPEAVHFLPAIEAHVTGNLCPECGAAALVREEGCLHCRLCSFSAC